MCNLQSCTLVLFSCDLSATDMIRIGQLPPIKPQINNSSLSALSQFAMDLAVPIDSLGADYGAHCRCLSAKIFQWSTIDSRSRWLRLLQVARRKLHTVKGEE